MEEDLLASCGKALSFGSLFLMSFGSVVCGSILSMDYVKQQKEQVNCKPVPMTLKKAFLFPLNMGIILFILLADLTSKNKNSDGIDRFILCGCVVLMTKGLFTIIRTPVSFVATLLMRDIPFNLSFTHGSGENKKYLIDFHFTTLDCFNAVLSFSIVIYYCETQHWVIRNIIAIGMAIAAIKEFNINKMVVGYVMLLSILMYVVLWTYFPDMMVHVDRKLPLPTSVTFPVDFLERGLNGKEFMGLGLVNIVVPGVFSAFLLRFDNSLNRNAKYYFHPSVVVYGLSLVGIHIAEYVLQPPQMLPIVGDLVILCLGTNVVLTLFRADFTLLLRYEDYPQTEVTPQGSSPLPTTSALVKKDN